MTRTIRLGVIPAAGEGKRMGYLSNIIPKSLFPLYDKPLIHHVIDNLVRIGVEEIVIPTFFQKDKMSEYFEKTKSGIHADIRLLPLQQLPKGIALTIESTRKYIDEPFMVILADDVTITNSLQSLVDLFFSARAIAVEGIVKEKNREVLRQTCCVKLTDGKKISEIYEKPSRPISNLRGCGIYVFDPEIFEYIERTPALPPRNEVEITNTLALVAKDGLAFGEFIDGMNINVNSADDLFSAWHAMRKERTRKGNGA